MSITREEFEQLEVLSKETEQLRNKLKEIQRRPIVSAYNISDCRSSRGGHSDRVFDLVAARDELERKINRNWLAMNHFINKIYNPLSLLSSVTPLEMRVSTALRYRYLDGISWDKIGEHWGIKGESCRRIVGKYKRTLN
ncbi:MAG: hypothetical protein Q4D42_10665 [Eubacteriales bacterium]|nr:hypothetical protein [Eubacteriales bacterium]